MDLLLEIATAVRSAVLPHLGDPALRHAEGVAVGGDPTFGIDEIAEAAALKVIEANIGDGLAWYTEDFGFVERGNPERVLCIDPIDGTRPAGAGLEAGTVSIASAPFSRDATLGDVDDAIVLEIKTGTLFRAKKGKGLLIVDHGETCSPSRSPKTRLDGAFFTYGLRGRPTIASALVLEELIDHSGVSGGTFDLGSATFGMTGVVTGRFDSYVDHGQRMIDDVPATKPMFEAIANGAILNNNPYDVAASKLICEEGGCAVSDAAGNSLDGHPLIGSGDGFTLSCVASCTPELHAEVVAALDRGIDRLRTHVAARVQDGA